MLVDVFTFSQQIWTPSWWLQEDFWDMWGAVWASSSYSHRFVCIFQTEIDCRQIILWHWLHSQIHFFLLWTQSRHPKWALKAFLQTYTFLICVRYVGALQGGFLHFWREVFSVWDPGFSRLEMNLSITSLTARPSCTNSTSRTAKLPTTGSKTFSGYLHHLRYCHVAKSTCRGLKLEHVCTSSLRLFMLLTFLVKLHIQLH